jgi:hypothetical protein
VTVAAATATTTLSQRVVTRAAARLDRPPKRRTPGPEANPRTDRADHSAADHSAADHSAADHSADVPTDDPASGPTRRSFLARTAIVGSALAVAPARFLLRPGTAYAAITDVCGPDANCTPGGFSVFCCTVNNGVNQCPPGSIPGGWWRAGTGSSWCCGADRYYIDCQATCPPGCGCDSSHFCPGCQNCTSGCNTGPSCDQRNVCRVRFRYGQCNQQVGCTGNVLCRMVSCTPPWLMAGLNCSSGPDKTDPETAAHGAPCLQQASWSGGAIPISARTIQASPAVAQALGSSRLDVFAKGGDQAIAWTSNAGGGWNSWRSLGGPPVGSVGGPAAVTPGAATLDLFARGGDNHLWQRTSLDAGRSWSSWNKPLGNDGNLASSPAVCSWGSGRVDVFVMGGDGAVYHRWYDHGWNSGWEYRGQPPVALQFGALAASARSPGHLDLFATAGGALWQTSYDGSWSGWHQPDNSAGQNLTSAPSSASWGRDHVAVFARGGDSALYWTNWFQGYWSGWQRVGHAADVFTGNPAAASGACQQLSVLARGPAGRVREYLYSG